jgi:hypothetical protein
MIYLIFVGIFIAIIVAAFALDVRVWRRRKTLLSKVDRLSRDLPRELENLDTSLARLETAITNASMAPEGRPRSSFVLADILTQRMLVPSPEWAASRALYRQCFKRSTVDLVSLREITASTHSQNIRAYTIWTEAVETQLKYCLLDRAFYMRPDDLSYVMASELVIYSAQRFRKSKGRVRLEQPLPSGCTAKTNVHGRATSWTLIKDKYILAFAFAQTYE